MTVQENFKSNRVTLGAIQRAVRTRSSLGKRKEREKREDVRKDSGRRYEENRMEEVRTGSSCWI